MGNAYSFIDVSANIVGPPGYSIDLAYGAGSAKEGIDINPVADQNTMIIGAGSDGMHSLRADKSGTITARFLKTSPTNSLLMAMFDAQRLSSSLWGQNIIIVRATQSGDVHNATECAFKKKPTIKYSEEGDIYEWTWDAIHIDSILGLF